MHQLPWYQGAAALKCNALNAGNGSVGSVPNKLKVKSISKSNQITGQMRVTSSLSMSQSSLLRDTWACRNILMSMSSSAASVLVVEVSTGRKVDRICSLVSSVKVFSATSVTSLSIRESITWAKTLVVKSQIRLMTCDEKLYPRCITALQMNVCLFLPSRK